MEAKENRSSRNFLENLPDRVWIWLIVFFAGAVYLGKLTNSFLMWDDFRFIVNRELIHSLANIPQFFTQGIDGCYRPLRTVLYALSYHFFGENPVGYQALGIFLYVVRSVAFYLLLTKIPLKPLLARVAGLLFAVHPLHVERVAWITASFNLLGDVFLLFAVALYLSKKGTTRSLVRSYLWAPFLICALFSSEMSLIFLPLVVCIDVITTGNWKKLRQNIIPAKYVVMILTVGFYLVSRLAVLGTLGRGVPRPAEGFFTTCSRWRVLILNT